MVCEKSSAVTGGLAVPSKDYDLQRREHEMMLGKDLLLYVTLPDAKSPVTLQVKESNEVGYVKLLLAEKCGLNANKFQLTFNDKPLIDPMSLCDHPGIEPPSIHLKLQYI